MHGKGVCHRDLKPRNILLAKGETQVKITDFNVSKWFKRQNGELVTLTTHTGTMAYSAPETLLHGKYEYLYLQLIARKSIYGALEPSYIQC